MINAYSAFKMSSHTVDNKHAGNVSQATGPSKYSGKTDAETIDSRVGYKVLEEDTDASQRTLLGETGAYERLAIRITTAAQG